MLGKCRGKWSCRTESQQYIPTMDEEKEEHEKEKQDKN
jgi:hypothetical protein